MQIEVLTVPGCPHGDAALSRVRQALVIAGRADAVVAERVITNPEQATAAGMIGSPTILIDGVDPFATESDRPSFSCRLFQTDSGLDGAPSIEDLAVSLR